MPGVRVRVSDFAVAPRRGCFSAVHKKARSTRESGARSLGMLEIHYVQGGSSLVCLKLVFIHQNQLQKHSRAKVTRVPCPSGGPSGDAVSLSVYMTDGILIDLFHFIFCSLFLCCPLCSQERTGSNLRGSFGPLSDQWAKTVTSVGDGRSGYVIWSRFW